MSFWLQDDDEDGGGAAAWSQQSSGGGAHLPQKQQQQFVCDNCGGTECYADDATGLDVCAVCFTESQEPSQSLSLLSQGQGGANDTADYEDVAALAARDAGGRIIRQQRQRAPGEGRRQGRPKQPLEQVDRSVPLPDVEACLKGMQSVLHKCVDIAVAEVLSNELVVEKSNNVGGEDDESDWDDADDESEEAQPLDTVESPSQSRQEQYREAARETMQSLWKSYLRAWADGAEHYGRMYPRARFCFRDLFLVTLHASFVVRRHLVHQAATTAAAAAVKQEGEEEDGSDVYEPFGSIQRDDASEESSSDDDEQDDGSPREEKEPVEVDKGVIGLSAIRKIVDAHTSHQHPMGYKEAALYMRPSMRMAAALVWMALTKNRKSSSAATAPVTSHDVCRWIAAGKLPLMTAFHSLLSPKLQKMLKPVATFFRLEKPLLPCQLEATAINLCVACRLRQTPKQTSKEDKDDSSGSGSGSEEEDDDSTATGKRGRPNMDDEPVEHNIVAKKRNRKRVRFWSVADLPRIIAHLVADAGLDQGTLDRALLLAGFSLEGPSKKRGRRKLDLPKGPIGQNAHGKSIDEVEEPPTSDSVLSSLPVVVQPEELTCVEEVLALIAIACQLDPQWRTWKYTVCQQPDQPAATAVPWNESQFRSLTNGPSLDSYLRYVEQCVFPDGAADANDRRDNQATMLPQEYFDAVGGSLESEVELYSKRKQAASVGGEDGESSTTAPAGVVRPCLVLAGAELQGEVEVTNLTHRSLSNDLGGLGRAFWAGRPSKKPQTSSTRRFKGRDKDLDPLIMLPRHDFRKAEYAASNRVPSSSPDPDQGRLVEFLAFTAGADPVALHRAMKSMIQQDRLP